MTQAIRSSFFLLLFVLAAICEGKPPQLSPRDVRVKVEEILKAHVCYKTLNPEIMQRTLQNFLEELDPTKTYFIESEIADWIYPSEAVLQRGLAGFKNNDFSLFHEIHAAYILAIERRNAIETDLLARKLQRA